MKFFMRFFFKSKKLNSNQPILRIIKKNYTKMKKITEMKNIF